MQNNHWLLPDGIDELLPERARVLEQLRRDLLDMYAGWGYQLVVTPVVEYLESLLTATGNDLELQTFKFIDQLSGRQLGLRADITPQAARIDAHQLRHDTPTRLCYIGSVLKTRPDGFSASRSPLQIGAELYGHCGVESDAEVLRLMLETVRVAGVSDIYLDLGHVGIFRSLARDAGLTSTQESALFEALQRKAEPEIALLLADYGLSRANADRLSALAGLNGDVDVLDRARDALRGAPSEVAAAIDYLEALGQRLQRVRPDVPLHYDLAELRAYHYQTGVVFAAFVPGQGQEIARGGRYDSIGAGFGRARPATGFSADLKNLLRLGSYSVAAGDGAILAPADDDAGLQQRIDELRGAGRVVIHELPGQQGELSEMGCTQRLVNQQGQWQLVDL